MVTREKPGVSGTSCVSYLGYQLLAEDRGKRWISPWHGLWGGLLSFCIHSLSGGFSSSCLSSICTSLGLPSPLRRGLAVVKGVSSGATLLGFGYGLNVYAALPNSYIEVLSPSMMVLSDEGFWEVIRFVRGVMRVGSLDGISILIRRGNKSLYCPHLQGWEN